MPEYKGKPKDLPDEVVGRPWEGDHQQTEVNFCLRCGRITTNPRKCSACKEDDKEFEIENVEAGCCTG